MPTPALSDVLHESSPAANLGDYQHELPFTQRFDLSMYKNPDVTALL